MPGTALWSLAGWPQPAVTTLASQAVPNEVRQNQRRRRVWIMRSILRDGFAGDDDVAVYSASHAMLLQAASATEVVGRRDWPSQASRGRDDFVSRYTTIEALAEPSAPSR